MILNFRFLSTNTKVHIVVMTMVLLLDGNSDIGAANVELFWFFDMLNAFV